ncbi:zinc finger protein [Coprinopsis sp. MPI-PUGE-AT-0042]|nr:zinc finger protein [Coprinopsis sp. MPI-PUGE-AT-0042]
MGDNHPQLQCCNDYHEYFSDPKIQQRAAPYAPATPAWDATAAENWDWCNYCHPRQDGAQTSPSFVPQTEYSDSFHQAHHHHHHHQPSSHFVDSSASSLPEKCMWNNCNASFSTLAELVGHVNLVHLHPSGESESPTQVPQQMPEVQQPPPPSLQSCEDFAASLSCLWHDCGTSVTAHPPVAQPSSTPDGFTLLETHLFRDHLGLDMAHLAALRAKPPASSTAAASSNTLPPISTTTDAPMPTPDLSDTASTFTDESRTAASRPSSRSPTIGAMDPHRCRWEGCDACFASCDDLTAHLNSVHVGSGKSKYECFWEGCNRNGTQWFSSKQKICRHLQSHTGHRPFQCTVCQQNFSEAATLQQHMRRHTQERPYACDYPGCGKSFAIMGALTIHKRTHNGLKPFKCKFCDKAFSESSNLSKHLRTHTGARPYSCTEPGCGKTFARPDQLTRHLAVHRKAEASQSAVASH